MRLLVEAAPAGQWPSGETAGSITLAFDDRNRRRLRLLTDQGEPVLLDLAKPRPLAEGDGLGFEDGGWLVVHAADEDVLDIGAADSQHLTRLAWHLGNRHLPTEILPEGLRIRYDHVIESEREPAFIHRPPGAPRRGRTQCAMSTGVTATCESTWRVTPPSSNSRTRLCE